MNDDYDRKAPYLCKRIDEILTPTGKEIRDLKAEIVENENEWADSVDGAWKSMSYYYGAYHELLDFICGYPGVETDFPYGPDTPDDKKGDLSYWADPDPKSEDAGHEYAKMMIEYVTKKLKEGKSDE